MTYTLQAHKDAWEKARILHRDISVGNIMIDVRSTTMRPLGFLNDWDMAKWERDLGEGASQPGVSVSTTHLYAMSSAVELFMPGNMALHFLASSAVPH
jgi:hypothetical protein